MTHFYELSTTTKQQCEAQAVPHFYATWQHSAICAFRMPTAAPLARDLSRMDFATTIGRAHSRCGLLAHGWSRSRILVSYMPLVHQRRPYPRLRRTLSQRAVPQRVVMVNYRSLPDKYANPLHNTAQKCDVVHLRRLLATPEFVALCPIDTTDLENHTAVHALCSYEGPQPCREDDRNAEDVEACLQLLVEAGADLEARDKLGCSPLQVLAWFSIVKFRTEATLRLTSLLLRHGANGGFLAFELDIALFAAARDPATARRRMAASGRLLPSAPCARRRGYPCGACAL